MRFQSKKGIREEMRYNQAQIRQILKLLSPKINHMSKIQSIKETISLIEKIRTDCPWAKQQTLPKQLNELKKEIKELEQSMDRDNLEEELGDVFWDLLMLIKISEEEYGFKFRRHPGEYSSEDHTKKTIRVWQ